MNCFLTVSVLLWNHFLHLEWSSLFIIYQEAKKHILGFCKFQSFMENIWELFRVSLNSSHCSFSIRNRNIAHTEKCGFHFQFTSGVVESIGKYWATFCLSNIFAEVLLSCGIRFYIYSLMIDTFYMFVQRRVWSRFYWYIQVYLQHTESELKPISISDKKHHNQTYTYCLLSFPGCFACIFSCC